MRGRRGGKLSTKVVTIRLCIAVNTSAPVARGRARSAHVEDVEEPAPRCLLGVPAADVRLGRVAPVPGRAHDHVPDHRVGFLNEARPRDTHRAADLGGVGPRQEVADELDRPAGRDLRSRLRDAEERGRASEVAPVAGRVVDVVGAGSARCSRLRSRSSSSARARAGAAAAAGRASRRRHLLRDSQPVEQLVVDLDPEAGPGWNA